MAKEQGFPNIPVHMESFVHPHVPSFTGGMRRLYAVCVGREKVLRRYLDRTPFELRDDRFLIEVGDYSGRTYPSGGGLWPFMDCGIIVPVRYGELEAGYYLFEYENEDYAIFAGREIWGYPKTYGEVSLVETDNRLCGRVVKRGTEIVQLEGHLGRLLDKAPELKVSPVLNIHTVPKADGPGIHSQRIILRDAGKGMRVTSSIAFEASLALCGIRQHPLDELGPLKIEGGGYQTADYTMDEKTGWGKVLEVLV